MSRIERENAEHREAAKDAAPPADRPAEPVPADKDKKER